MLSSLSRYAVLLTAMAPCWSSHRTGVCQRWPPPLPADRAEQELRLRSAWRRWSEVRSQGVCTEGIKVWNKDLLLEDGRNENEMEEVEKNHYIILCLWHRVFPW